MKIYAVADLHGKEKYIHRINHHIKQFNPDVLILAGDLTNYLNYHTTNKWLEQIKTRTLAVTGNSDFQGVKKFLKAHDMLLSAQPITINDIPIIGISGTIPLPFSSRICLNEKHALGKLESSVSRQTVMVAHPPPRGTCDKVMNRFSAGSTNLAKFIENHQPQLLLCGHIHEQAGDAHIKNTLVVNCAINRTAGGALIEFSKDSSPKVKMLGKP